MTNMVLNIVESGYRGTLEEQDDTLVWLTHSLKGAGAPIDVLLRGSAVNYAVRGQDASGLAFGERRQTHPPDLAGDLAKLIGKGVAVLVVEEDLAERGIGNDELIDGLRLVSRRAIPRLFGSYERIWHW